MPRPKTSKPWLKGLKPDEEKVARNFVMYSQCSGHFVPGGIDHIFAVLVMPTHWKLIEPCQIYCYEDDNSEVRKFGISKDHRTRAKHTKRQEELYIKRLEKYKDFNESKDRPLSKEINFGAIYDKFLWYEACPTRSEAICIESLLKKELIVKKNLNKYKETGEEIKDLFGIHMNTIGSFSGAEITDISGDELRKMVLNYRKEWLELNSEGFLRKYFAEECNKFDEDVRKIISREYKFTIENGNIYYKNKGLADKANKKKGIPLENIPKVFYESYNFSLILDSCWS